MNRLYIFSEPLKAKFNRLKWSFIGIHTAWIGPHVCLLEYIHTETATLRLYYPYCTKIHIYVNLYQLGDLKLPYYP